MEIVGGGVVGCALAYFLAREGRRVVVHDAGAEPGAGSTGRATGGLRSQFADVASVRLAMRTRELLAMIADETGVDPEFRACGYLFCASEAAHVEALALVRDAQRRAGDHPGIWLAPEDVASRFPYVETSDLLGAQLGVRDGFLRPMLVLEAFRRGAEARGAEFRWNSRRTDGDVIATGAWAGEFGLPVAPIRRCVAVSIPNPPIPADGPMIIDLATGFHVRVRDGRALLLWPDPDQGPGYETSPCPEFFVQVRAHAARRIPALASFPIDVGASWGGLYENTPDRLPLVGWVGDRFVATGFSGHGVMLGPAAMEAAASWLVSGSRPDSLADWDPARPMAPGVHLL